MIVSSYLWKLIVKQITNYFWSYEHSIKNTKSVGLDDISSRVLKLATDAFQFL